MRVIKTTLFILFTCLALTSCDNEPLEGTFTDEIGTGGGSGSGGGGSTSFFAKVDGVEFDEQTLIATEASGILGIIAQKSDGTSITIQVPSDITAGTYDLSSFTYNATYTQMSPTTATLADSGSLAITSHDTSARSIVGTFNFVSTPTGATTPEFTITDGSFSVSY